MLFDKVILSCDLNPLYTDFIPLVTTAWKKIFGCKVSLTLVGSGLTGDYVRFATSIMGYVDELHYICNISKANNGVIGKVARLIAAQEEKDNVCLLNDTDLIPLGDFYLKEKLSDYQPGTILCLGSEFFHSGDTGKFPLGNTTADGNTFREILNPMGLIDLYDILAYWDTIEVFPTDCTNKIINPTYSDESLFRTMIAHWNKPERTIRKPGILHPSPYVIDRTLWHFDEEKLCRGEYAEAHMLRPYNEYKTEIKPIVDYIRLL
jgi:hypothetical protein